MTKIKICGIRRECDIDFANQLKPDYIGFVFAKKSFRYVDPEFAKLLKFKLLPDIKAVGVFVDEAPETVAGLLNSGVIDIAQLHGSEDNEYISFLKKLSPAPIIQAFKISSQSDISKASASIAELILLDSGAGSGKLFDHSLITNIKRDYFLAGGVTPDNAGDIINKLAPFALDASSSLETGGFKDFDKMQALIRAVR